MTEIVFKEDIGKEKLNALLDFIKSLNIEAENVKVSHSSTLGKNLFSSTIGIWKDRDVDNLRSDSWARVK